MNKPTISIDVRELGEGYVQYESVVAEISIDGTNYFLESMLLDNEDEQADLDVIHGFVGVWEGRAETGNIDFYIDDEVHQLIIELDVTIALNDEHN